MIKKPTSYFKAIRISFIALLIATNSCVNAKELKDLLNSDTYEEDIRLSKVLHKFIFTHNKQWSDTNNPISNHSGDHPYLTINSFQAAQLWKSEIKPLCNRFKKTYRVAYEKDLHEINDQKNHKQHIHAKKTFKENFQHDVFVHCDELSAKIDNFHSHSSKAKKVLPKLISEYKQLFAIMTAQDNTLLNHAFEQDSATYKKRKNLEARIRVILSWLETDHDSHKQSIQFKSEFETTQQAFKQFIANHKGLKTALPIHRYIHDDDKPMQMRISKAFQKKFNVTPHHIIIRQQSIKRDIHRLTKKEGQLHGHVFSALSFSAVLAIHDEETVSTHFGWIEFHSDGSAEAFLKEGENNFRNPRRDQLHTYANRS